MAKGLDVDTFLSTLDRLIEDQCFDKEYWSNVDAMAERHGGQGYRDDACSVYVRPMYELENDACNYGCLCHDANADIDRSIYCWVCYRSLHNDEVVAEDKYLGLCFLCVRDIIPPKDDAE